MDESRDAEPAKAETAPGADENGSPETPAEFNRFAELMRKLTRVPKSELKAELDAKRKAS